MPKKQLSPVDEYLARFPAASQSKLRRVRTLIQKALPDAVEAISYQIPTFKVDGRAAIYFAGWKEHFSIYPASESLVEAMGAALDGYEVQKGTIRFPLDGPVPAHLISRIAKFRAQETRARAKVVPVKKRSAVEKVPVRAAKKATETATKKAPAKKKASKKSLRKP